MGVVGAPKRVGRLAGKFGGQRLGREGGKGDAGMHDRKAEAGGHLA